ncbi:MAG: sigma-70 family RNA polymerase sigma factor [Saprospiraceae bacterium]|nr:sigma-70 family RNA polymerase sigma factor [Saprospiraceae bacterium]
METSKTLEDWVKKYSDILFRRAYFLTSNREVAEDIVQETFLAAVKAIEGFSWKSEPKTWLLGILSHKTADYFRQKFRNPEVGADDFFTTTGDWKGEQAPSSDWLSGTENLLDNVDFQKVLHQCLDDLPEIWRGAFLLKFLENKKGPVICQELGITQTNFWQILHRAKLQLRRCIEVYWFK